MLPMLPGWSAARSCAERSHEPDRSIAPDDIGSDHTKRCCYDRADIEIVYQHDDGEHRPDREQRQGKATQAHHAYRVYHVEWNKREHDQDGDREAGERRRQM